MRIGKLSNHDLARLVLSRLPAKTGGVQQGPGIGLDCAAVRFGDGHVVLTSDPITGATVEIGRLAIQISCNDVAAAGIRPSAIMLVVIAPPDTDEKALTQVIDQAASTAQKLNVSIVGGHTEVSDAVRRFLLVTTAVGMTYGRGLVSAAGGKANDALLMTKSAGIEGTAILAGDCAKQLSSSFSAEELQKAKAMIDRVSVIEEGAFAGGFTVHAMHDATEGGILGACWELAEASGLGCLIQSAAIPVHDLTRRICGVLRLDPLRLIASGSMIMATDRPDELIGELAQRGIDCVVIGKLTADPVKRIQTGDAVSELLPPESDEIYKVLGQSDLCGDP